MSRKGVTMIVGVAALIGLSGAYFALKGYNEDQAEQEVKEAEGEEILNIDSASVESLEFTINGEQISFVKKDDVWKKADDETFPVDESYILSPLTGLAPLNAVRKLEDVEDISEYGIEEPQNTIRLTDADGNETEIVIGSTNSGTGDDYVMLNGDETVIYTVSSDLRDAFSDDLYDYAVSEDIPYLQASEVTKVSVEKADGSYELYLEDALWKCAADSADVVETGAEDSEDVVVMETEDSENVAETEDGKDKDVAITEPEDSEDAVEASTEDREDTAEAETEDCEDAVVIETADSDSVMDADADMINDALADLSGLSYTDYVEHNCEDASAYGLGDSAAVLTVYWQEEVEAEEADAEAENTAEEADAENTAEVANAETENAAEEIADAETENVTEEADAEAESTAEVETESETEAVNYETYSLTFRIGDTDASGNYYVQQEGSKEVHTISYSVLSQFVDASAESWELIEEETESETESVTE